MEAMSSSFNQDQIDLLLNVSLVSAALSMCEYTEDVDLSFILKDSREVSKLLRAWETSQPVMRAPPTRDDKLRKTAKDLVETEAQYVAVIANSN